MYKVILIDDEPLIIKGLMRRVDWESLGFQISGTFSTPNAALDYFQTDWADLALMDIRMPTMTGIELMEQIRRQSNCRFIVISGHSDFHYAQAAIQLGASDYLLKPVANHILTASVIAVKKVLDKAAEDRANRLQRALFSSGDVSFFRDEFLPLFDVYQLPTAFRCCVSDDPAFSVPESRTIHLFSKNGMHFFLVCCYGDALPESDSAIFSESFASPEETLSALESLRFASYAPFLTYMPLRDTDTGPLESFVASLHPSMSTQDSASSLTLICGIAHLFRKNRYPMNYFEPLFNAVCSSLVDQPLPSSYLSADEIVALYSTIDEAQAALQDLFTQNRQSSNNERPHNNQQIIQAIISEMRTNYHENLTLKFFADKYYLNMTYLSMLFKSVTQESFVSLLTRIRMENSANLLASTDLLIEQISRACGYNDVSYFNRAFKKFYHMTPTVYRTTYKVSPHKETI